MPDGPPVLIIDLDGTLLTVNSFRRWARFLLRAPFAGRPRTSRIRISLEVAGLLLGRRLRFIDHARLRSGLRRMWRSATSGDGGAAERALLDDLERFVRPELRPVVAAIAAGEVHAILATAAVPDYALGFAKRLGFRDAVAAPVPRGATPGIPKRDAVCRLLADLGWQHRPRVLFTDHLDDLPLARECGRVVWFGDRETEMKLRAVVPGVEIRSLGDVWPR